jgi:hypothetical protein
MPLLEYNVLLERFRATIDQVRNRFDSESDLEFASEQIRGIHGRVAQQGQRDLALAVIGGMRLGKSSLINALVGDNLAAVGLRETTAVINVIRYGEDMPEEIFEVHWADGRIERVNRNLLDQWQGSAQNAERTAHIEFRRPVPFLRDLAIIDTPGTGSTIEKHEQVLSSCIARAEDLTRRECTKADAVLYVMPSVAKQRDQDLLRDVQMNSRGTALSPFNCFGVIHMWEAFVTGTDHPWETALEMAAKNYQELEELVSGVIPVSAPLITLSRIANTDQLNALALLAMETSEKDFTMMLIKSTFGKNTLSCPLDGAERLSLQESLRLPWPCLTTLLRLLRKSKPGSAEEVRNLISYWGGRDSLMNELERRFFSRVEMVRSATLLQTFSATCQQAEQTLRTKLRALVRAQIQLGEKINQARRESMEGEIIHDPAVLDLKRQRTTLEEKEAGLRITMRLAGDESAKLEDDFRELDLDLRALNLLRGDTAQLDEKQEEQQQALRALFGHYGASPHARMKKFLGKCTEEPDRELTYRILEFRRKLNTQQGAKDRWLNARAIERMEDLLHWWQKSQGSDNIDMDHKKELD